MRRWYRATLEVGERRQSGAAIAIFRWMRTGLVRTHPIPQRPEAAAVTAEHFPKARAFWAGDGAIASAGLASIYKYDESLAIGFRHTAILAVLPFSVEVSV
jgi:hypothetical protein